MDLLGHRTKIIVFGAINSIIPPPFRERNDRSTRSKDSKRQDEERHQTGTVKGARDEVAVVLEDAGAIVAQVVLDVEAADDPAEEDAGLRLVVW
jgi:hypothetical protein